MFRFRRFPCLAACLLALVPGCGDPSSGPDAGRKGAQDAAMDGSSADAALDAQADATVDELSDGGSDASIVDCGEGLGPLDMKTFFPNLVRMKTHYLIRRKTDSISEQVLWFEAKDKDTFYMYNSTPLERCHRDTHSWWDDGYMRYIETLNACSPTAVRTRYLYDNDNPGFIFIPETWIGTTPWQRTATVAVEVYSETGDTTDEPTPQERVCAGTNAYTNTLLGWERLESGQCAIHLRSEQLTTWTDGTAMCGSGCCKGYQTDWQEDYWFALDIPVEGGGTDRGMVATEGGNKMGTIGIDRWDSTFDGWDLLPTP
ncbi:MAG: hypothetical protein KC416_02930 [Myxococcales bacterium]|nr:hypothetical protein [Myxococcales bacterium]